MIGAFVFFAIMIQSAIVRHIFDRALRVADRETRWSRNASNAASFILTTATLLFLLFGNVAIADWVLQ